MKKMYATIKTNLFMKKISLLLSTIFLLNGCAESLALLGPGASNGRFMQSSLNSAISYGVKKQTGKTPLEHAIAYAETKNPERKKETCISSFEITRSEFCTIVKKQINLKSTAVKKKTVDVMREYPKNIVKKVSEIEKIAKKSIIYNRR